MVALKKWLEDDIICDEQKFIRMDRQILFKKKKKLPKIFDHFQFFIRLPGLKLRFFKNIF